MVRTYVKKTARKPISPIKLQAAAKLVKAGWAVRAAARHHNVNKSSLWSVLKRMNKLGGDLSTAPKSEFKTSHSSRNIFTPDQEDLIVKYCVQIATLGYGLSVQQVRELAWQVAERNNLSVPENWKRDGLAGIDWFQGFKKRHSQKIYIRTPEACSVARAMAFNKPAVHTYFNKLEEVLSRHECFRDGSRVYNLDETSTSTVQNTKKLVSPKGCKQVHQVKSAERGVSVTTTVVIGAFGTVLPPVMIFPRKHFKSSMIINAYPGTKGLANEKGYNTKEVFPEVLRHFIKCTNSTKENPTLLMLDNVGTHFSTEALDIAKDNGVVIFTFPPHCTHRLQPLDVGFFSPFKAYYDSAVHSFMHSNPGVVVTIYHVAGFVREALSKAATPSTIIASFQKTGICPYNRNVFQEADFIMASVTEQPTPEDPDHNPDDPDGNPNDLISPDGPLQEPPFSPDSNEKPLQGEEPVSTFISPESIRGYPHAKRNTTNRKQRRKGKCMIATDTPEKLAITQRENETKGKKRQADERKRKREQIKASKKNESQNITNQSKKSKKKKTNRVLTYDTSSDRNGIQTISESELESEDSEMVDVEAKDSVPVPAEPFRPLDRSPSEGEFVLVCFLSKDKKYFVGKIIQEEDTDGDLQISYMRRTNAACPRFVLPPIPDLNSVHINDIKQILPMPTYPVKTTRRQKSIVAFDFDFGSLNLG